MKKLIFGLIITISTLNAQSTEDFFYKRGYELGIQKGYDLGVADAIKEAKEMLRRYEAQLNAYEIGKFLIKNQNLTYPQVWQELKDDGSFALRVMPSEIVKELNVEALFKKFYTIPTMKQEAKGVIELDENEQNSIYLSNRDSNINELPQSVSQANTKTTLNIKKTSKNLEILKKANVVFSDEDNFYRVLFFSDNERKDFCSQFGICK